MFFNKKITMKQMAGTIINRFNTDKDDRLLYKINDTIYKA